MQWFLLFIRNVRLGTEKKVERLQQSETRKEQSKMVSSEYGRTDALMN